MKNTPVCDFWANMNIPTHNTIYNHSWMAFCEERASSMIKKLNMLTELTCFSLLW